MSDNMKLWESVEKTDPKMTKRVNQRGGFTAICAQYQLRRATEVFGPFGAGWGLRELRFAHVRNAAGEIVEQTLEATFFYPGGEFPIATDIAYRPGDDGLKKLRTDAITKSLSTLGFNSDVFEGKFDDNKYVQERGREESKPRKQQSKKHAQKPQEQPDGYEAVLSEGLTYIGKVNTATDADAMLASIAEWGEKDKLVGTSELDLKKALNERVKVQGLEYNTIAKKFYSKE